MRLPIDTTNMTLVAGKVEPVTDFETKKHKADANGELLYAVDLVAFGDEGPQIWPVKVAGEPRGVIVGQAVKVSGLVAVPWAMEDRHGISFRAASLGPSAAPASSKGAA